MKYKCEKCGKNEAMHFFMGHHYATPHADKIHTDLMRMLLEGEGD